MNSISEARAILHSAEQQLRKLMEVAIKAGCYSDVTRLADMAQALGRIAGANVTPLAASSPPEESTQSQPHSVPSSTPIEAPTKRKKVAAFPKFEIDGDRLVKIGWSKREKSEYEHKAPRDVVICVYERLGKVAQHGQFRMEDLFPISQPDGSEVPSYQSYLVLAWLRYIGQIEKLGRDSYQWHVDDITESSFKHAWNSTPRRGSVKRGKAK